MAERVMLDPSLFTSFRTLRIIRTAIEAGELENAFVPASFLAALQRSAFSEHALAYFGASRNEIRDLRNIPQFLPELFSLAQHEASPVQPTTEFQRELLALARDFDIFQILNEEWAFLNSESWIAARTKRSFASFIRAGAVGVEAGRKVFNKTLAKTLKVSPENVPTLLSPKQKVRAAMKWIAVGGSSASALLHNPLSGVLVNAALGYFLLFDP